MKKGPFVFVTSDNLEHHDRVTGQMAQLFAALPENPLLEVKSVCHGQPLPDSDAVERWKTLYPKRPLPGKLFTSFELAA